MQTQTYEMPDNTINGLVVTTEKFESEDHYSDIRTETMDTDAIEIGVHKSTPMQKRLYENMVNWADQPYIF